MKHASVLENRRAVLASLDASDELIDELLTYNTNAFQQLERLPGFPMGDEPHLEVWSHYQAEMGQGSTFDQALRGIPQTRFPVREGRSEDEHYRAATRKGTDPDTLEGADGLVYADLKRIELSLHNTAAGRVPVITAQHRQDFETLVRAFARRGEPTEVPASMGATTVAGFNNWDRIQRARRAWEADNPGGDFFAQQFAAFRMFKSNYQDVFIILSHGPYSDVPAEQLGLEKEEWLSMSSTIRLEHECCHYLTRRLFASMRNNVHDELIADYMGIRAAVGYYKPEWFMAFVGLEDYPNYRDGGRLQNYRGDLSDAGFALLHHLVKRAADNVAAFDQVQAERINGTWGPAYAAVTLTHFSLEELAHEDAPQRLAETLVSLTKQST